MSLGGHHGLVVAPGVVIPSIPEHFTDGTGEGVQVALKAPSASGPNTHLTSHFARRVVTLA